MYSVEQLVFMYLYQFAASETDVANHEVARECFTVTNQLLTSTASDKVR